MKSFNLINLRNFNNYFKLYSYILEEIEKKKFLRAEQT